MTKLAIHGGQPILDNEAGRFRWPVYDEQDERALIGQLHESVSIYDKSGVIKEFEDAFSAMHDANYALLSNSGTSAIFSMFEALNLQPGDEVLCPVYTFHATVSPMMYTGAIPVFCDTDAYGNISYDDVVKKLTAKTKALIITHIWGMPVKDAKMLTQLCDEKGIYLLEDCSHAHGASIDGKVVGTFGHMSAWSLQGQKTVTGGEGGIMLTNDKALYDRALLQGHYNKRPKTEIESKSSLHKFYLTGMGQKFRAHPLAIRLALGQLNKLKTVIDGREGFATKIADALADIPFLKVLMPPQGHRSSWYALILLFDEKKSGACSKDQFVEALHAEGLSEMDIPGSTGLLNDEPLFTEPNQLLNRLYTTELPHQSGFTNAQSFTSKLIKMPVWNQSSDEAVVLAYIEGIKKVANHITANNGLVE